MHSAEQELCFQNITPFHLIEIPALVSNLEDRDFSMTDTAMDTPPTPVVELRQRIEPLQQRLEARENNLRLWGPSGEFDKLSSAYTNATGAAACGIKASMVFTSWATAAFEQRGHQATGRRIVERILGWMLPGGLSRQRLSRLNIYGVGRWMMSRAMARKNVANLQELIATADDVNVAFIICERSRR